MGEGALGRAKRSTGGVRAARWGRRYLPLVVGLAIALGALNSGSAWAAPIVELKVGFKPDRLSTSTTIKTAFHIRTTTGAVPPPLLSVDLDLPAGMGLATTELGLSTCSTKALEIVGVVGCPPNAVMGFGEGVGDVAFGPEVIHQAAAITILMGEPLDEHTSLLFYVNAQTPVSAQLIFPTVLLPGVGPDSAGQLDTTVPLTPTLPGAEYVSVVNVRTSFGPEGLTYFRHVHGRVVPFTPRGFVTPSTCPQGGFPFRGTFTFQEGSVVSSRAAVPCPTVRKRL
jgi:hypothetical protein